MKISTVDELMAAFPGLEKVVLAKVVGTAGSAALRDELIALKSQGTDESAVNDILEHLNRMDPQITFQKVCRTDQGTWTCETHISTQDVE